MKASLGLNLVGNHKGCGCNSRLFTKFLLVSVDMYNLKSEVGC